MGRSENERCKFDGKNQEEDTCEKLFSRFMAHSRLTTNSCILSKYLQAGWLHLLLCRLCASLFEPTLCISTHLVTLSNRNDTSGYFVKRKWHT